MRQTLARVTLFAAAGRFHGGVLADVRLTNDFPGGGYVSVYTLATGNAYSDATLAECSRSRGRQNEPSVAVNPRNINVIIGSLARLLPLAGWRPQFSKLAGPGVPR